MIRIIDIIRQKRDHRHQLRYAIDAASIVETLEQRQLLTLTINFEFTA